MSNRYDDRDEERRGRNYGRRSDSDYDRSYGERSQGYGRDENERDRYSTESRWRGQYGGGREYGDSQSRGSQYGGEHDRGEYGGSQNRGWELGREYGGGQSRGWQSGSSSEYGGPSRGGQWGGSQYGGGEYGGGQYTGGQYGGSQYGTGQWGGGGQNWRSGRQNQSGREDYTTRGWDRDYTSGRQSRYGSSGRDYGQSGFGFGERYGERGRGYEGRGDYDRGDYGGQEERGWWDRASDAVASWFGDEEAERRRRMDEQRRYRGRGPKGYRRSDERIKEDVNDRLSEGYLDASDIEVSVTNAEVTLTGTVNSRNDKRRAEDIAESVAGVTNVENRIRVKHSDMDRYTGLDTSSTSGSMGTTGTTGTTGATGTSDTSTSTGTTGTARGRTAGTT